MTEEEKVAYLLEIFEWDDSDLNRYHALRILRGVQQLPAPTWEDFRAGVDR